MRITKSVILTGAFLVTAMAALAAPKPQTAADLMSAATRSATAQRKAILVLFGASW